MTEEELLKYISITDDKVIFDKVFYENTMMPCMNNAINKNKLISFLEEKIKNYEESIENSKPYLEHKELFQQVQNDIHTSKCIIANLKDVLDFVNKGDKE